MQDRILSLLGLAEKAGKVSAGGFSTEEAIKSRKACLVILAEDAQSNTAKKITDKCVFYKIPVMTYGKKDDIGRAVGKESRACAAVTDRGFARSILKKAAESKPSGGEKEAVAAAAADPSRAAPEGADSVIFGGTGQRFPAPDRPSGGGDCCDNET